MGCVGWGGSHGIHVCYYHLSISAPLVHITVGQLTSTPPQYSEMGMKCYCEMVVMGDEGDVIAANELAFVDRRGSPVAVCS